MNEPLLLNSLAACGEILEAPKVQVSIDVNQLSVTIHGRPPLPFLPKSLFKQTTPMKVLENVSLYAAPGELMAIMGGSGSGKTTLLNFIAGRCKSDGVETVGSVQFNETDPDKYLGKCTGYVLQSDSLLPNLTVRETLDFAAALRLVDLNPEQRVLRVNEVIAELGLKDCERTLVGTTGRGISGGEKRRVSIAVQMLTSPSVLFLDEPTTGLDSASAFQVVQMLSRLASQNRTVICSIHQPRSDIFDLFSSILLLSRGRQAFYGSPAEIADHFASLGHPCPPYCSIADHVLDVSSIDFRTAKAEASSRARVEKLISACPQIFKKHIPNSDSQTITPEPKKHGSFFREVYFLSRRAWLNLRRDFMTVVGGLLETIILSLTTGYIYFKLSPDPVGLKNTWAISYLSCSQQPYLVMLFSIFKMCAELQVYDREQEDKMYSPFSWVLSQFIASFFPNLFFSSIFAVVLYTMAGMRYDDGLYFLVYVSAVVLVQFTGVAYAWMSCGVFREFSRASLIANSSVAIWGLTSGFFINPDSYPIYVGFLRYTSFIQYGVEIISVNQLKDLNFECPTNISDEICAQYSGDFWLSQFGINTSRASVISSAAALLTLFLSFNLLFVFFLKMFPRKTTYALPMEFKFFSLGGKSGEKYDKIRESICEEYGETVDTQIEGQPPAQVEQKHLHRRNLDAFSIECVDVSVAASGGFSILEKLNLRSPENQDEPHHKNNHMLLHNISFHFPPAQLTVVMGGSGGGKTTLLNTLAGRLTDDQTVRGKVLINGVEAGNRKQYIGYVTQHDELLPLLTVRETLNTIAKLRLPTHMTKIERREIVEGTISELGLRECANTYVGSALHRGLSGGEQRRLSVAVALINDPPILLLDEATSGLDSYSAHNLLHTLKHIANRGRTVIVTLHQPRSDVFPLFDNIVLLSKGRLTYAGPGPSLIPYLSQKGFPCPLTTNPSDFAVDCISVDMRSADAEIKSRSRLMTLVSEFKLEEEKRKIENPPASSGEISTKLEPIDFRANFLSAFGVLTVRSLKNMFRQPEVWTARLMQVMSLGGIFAFFFSPLPTHGPAVVQNRIGLVYEISVVIFVGMLNCVTIFPQEKKTFEREHADGVYGLSPFFLSYFFIEILMEIFSCSAFTLLVCIATGLTSSFIDFLKITFASIALVNVGESIGLFVFSIFGHIGFGVNLISVILGVLGIMGGMLAIDMPHPLQLFNNISIARHFTTLVASITFKDLIVECEPTDGCPYKTGEEVLESFRMADTNQNSDLLYIAIIAATVRLVAFLFMLFRRR